jgi:hypothetical protein
MMHLILYVYYLSSQNHFLFKKRKEKEDVLLLHSFIRKENVKSQMYIPLAKGI